VKPYKYLFVLMIFLLRRKHQEFLELKFMKKNQLLFILSIFSSLFNTLNAQRQLVSLNKEWDFNGASLWEESIEEVVDLPHTWNTEDAAQGYTYFRGEGNYTKKYFVDQSLKGKRLFLKFE